jgi:uncharacterized protein YwqG
MSCIAQLDLAALPRDLGLGLPPTGLLAFFLGVDEPASDVEHRVLYFDEPAEQLETRRPPKETVMADERDFQPFALRLAAAVSLPSVVPPELEAQDAVEYRRAVKQVELGNVQCQSLDTQQAHQRQAYWVRAFRRARGENAAFLRIEIGCNR